MAKGGTIITDKFSTFSREEIDHMLGTALQTTRVYQEAQAEERRSLMDLQLAPKVGALTP